MTGLTFCKNYKYNEAMRKSFNELAAQVFGLNFEEWYEKGFWNDRYIPFSYAEGDRIVANVSVNLLDLMIEGELKRAIQIGTVMTHPDYRNRGLSANLMNMVFEEYEDRYDLMYLFANLSVLDFYPKFGFERVEEVQFSMDYSWTQPAAGGIRKLDGRDPYHLNFIYRLATERVPVSKRFSTQNAQGILMFYCIYIFPDDLYYLEEEDAVIIFTTEGKQINLYDVISKNEIGIKAVLSRISSKDTSKIVFHYTPEDKNITTKSQVVNGDHVLFVKANGNHKYPFHVKHPITSRA